MVVLIILGILFLIIFAIMMISIGIDFRFEDGVIRLSAKVSRFHLQILPKRKTEKKEEKPKNKSEKQVKEKPEKRKNRRKKRKVPYISTLMRSLNWLDSFFGGSANSAENGK